ncbi:LuxR C-terminal-related transcriptional regulator [Saccharopolyspora sp. NPDC002376]
MITLIIVAETRFYRESLVLALRSAAPRLDVVAAVARPEQLRPGLARRSDGVLLLDVVDARDGPDVVNALRRRNPRIRIVALGVSECEADIIDYAEAGAAGYLTRDNSIPEMVCTIESVARGEMRCSPRVAATLSRRVAELAAKCRPLGAEKSLSPREIEIAVLLEKGLSNQQISRRLCIAVATVKNHVHNILEKLGLPGRADVAAWAWRQGLHRIATARQLPQTSPSGPDGNASMAPPESGVTTGRWH